MPMIAARPMIGEAPHEVARRQSESLNSQAKHNNSSCSTCEIIRDLSGDLRDLTPQVEAILIEHLFYEHHINPYHSTAQFRLENR
jgi:hypothetical protein